MTIDPKTHAADLAELRFWRVRNADVMDRAEHTTGRTLREQVTALRLRAMAEYDRSELPAT